MDTEKEIIVSCKNIKKTYGFGETAVHALRDGTLDIRSGESVMIMGPSGSGKTTLISIIAGLLTQTEGECTVYGQDINHLSEEKRTSFRGQTMGFVFQNFNLIPMLTSRENVSIPLIIHGMGEKEALSKSDEALARVNLEDKLYAFPHKLSGGQQQRVAIARAMVHNPKIMLCDEPTSNLDYTQGEKILDLLRSLVHSNQHSLIVVTHDPRMMSKADRVLNLEDGQILNKDL